MKVSELMNREFISVAPTATITDVAKKMRERYGKFVVILERGRVLGTVCDRDIVTKIVANDIDPSSCHVSILASAPSSQVSVTPDTELIDAAKIMAERHCHCLCVTDRGNLVGLLSLDDLARHSETIAGAVLKKVITAEAVDSLV